MDQKNRQEFEQSLLIPNMKSIQVLQLLNSNLRYSVMIAYNVGY